MRLENINLKFDSRGIAGLHGVDLELWRGEIFALLGPNGAGKTTLLKFFAGELVPDHGKVVPAQSCASLSHGPLTADSVQELLLSGIKRDLSTEQKIQLTRDMATSFEFTSQLRQGPRNLSAGQLQRVRLAQALIDAPGLLLLDEPFAHLDAPIREEIWSLLRPYLKEREITCLWVTHDPQEALSYSDRLAVMNFGKIEQVGTPQEMFKAPKNLVVASLLGHQNFITITREGSHWATPFGPWESHQAPGKAHLALSIPPHAFHVHAEGKFEAVVESVLFKGHFTDLVLAAGDQKWRARVFNSQAPTLNAKVRFDVEIKKAVGIDCL